jgi:predicted ester cyclase
MVAEGDKVAYSWHWTGTHTGEYRGVAPTGKTVNVAGMVIYQFADSKLVDAHGVSSPDIRQYLLGSQ